MKKWLSLMLAAVLVIFCAAASAETVKHERVFAVLNPDGEVESLTDSVRLENRDKLDVLTDSTLLTGIVNVSGHESFTLDGSTLTWDAKGKDVTYQGTSGKTLPVKPVITLTLDGTEISAKELAKKSGRAELTVRYEQPDAVPHLAVSLLLLPETGVSALETENAEVISLFGRQAVIGWAVPGVDESVKLPSSFSVRFDADRTDIGWMMTFASADPLDAVCKEIGSRLPLDPGQALDEAATLLTALQKGEDLPGTAGILGIVTGKINDLNNGLAALNDSAKELSDGVVQLKEGSASFTDGAAELGSSLSALGESSRTLIDGADAVFGALLDAANRQLSNAGDQSLKIPELTADNYDVVLSGTIAKLDRNDAQQKVLAQSLQELLTQLAQAQAFVRGVKNYTAGVDQAAGGAAKLSESAAALSSGVQELADGAKKLHDQGTNPLKNQVAQVEQLGATMLLTTVNTSLRSIVDFYETTRAGVAASGYDLRPEGMKTVTVYIIRSDMQ